MKTKERSLIILIIIFTIILLVLLSIKTDDSLKNSNNELPDDQNDNNNETPTGITAPLNETFSNTSYINNSLWDQYNVHTSLNKAFYISNLSVEEIIDWYFNTYMYGEWKVKSTKQIADPDNLNITTGYIRLEKNHSYGAFIFLENITNHIVQDTKEDTQTLIGAAEGEFILVLDCGKEE